MRDHRSLRHRIKWWFLRRTPEYRRCRRVAEQWNAEGFLHWTPGMVWTLRAARRAGGGLP